MNIGKCLDCVVIGYNEVPFAQYERFLRNYGEDTEAYRDLRFSFIDLEDKKLDYVGLMNHAGSLAGNTNGKTLTETTYKSGDIPNLAAVYLTTFLRRSGLEARYINLFQYQKDLLLEYLRREPLCVAITTTFYVVNLPLMEMIEFIREHNSKVKIVVGGPLISNHHRNYRGEEFRAALEDIGADIYVVEGQGEFTLSQIVACLKNDGDLSLIPNLAYFENRTLRVTKVAPENNSLDTNVINWSAFPAEDLGATIQTRTARSCAFKCSFCNYPTRAGALTLASVESIEKELNSMRELGSVRNVVFIDDTFNVPFPRFKDICRMMIRNKYEFNWFSYFRCSNSDEEAIELMAQSGCKGVFLGVESGSPTILVNMNKSATIQKYQQGIDWLRNYGILTFASLITGFPGETTDTVNETIDFIRQTKPDYYRSQMWYCEPGTPIENQREKYQIEGEGFVWSHATMNSLEAMDHIDRMFLTIKESIWLPQWSFDFWIIPYLIGKGISLEQFMNFMSQAHKMLALEIASVSNHEKRLQQQKYLSNIVAGAKGWPQT